MFNYQSSKVQVSAQDQSRDELGVAEMLKALGDPSRLSIFNMLMEGVQCNCEIAERLGFSLSLVSHHLHILRQVGLVQCEHDPTDARWIYYSINRHTLAGLDAQMRHLLDIQRIQPRLPSCGPRGCDRC
jgi:DNA-binding transcriptional ArsR family regulator